MRISQSQYVFFPSNYFNTNSIISCCFFFFYLILYSWFLLYFHFYFYLCFSTPSFSSSSSFFFLLFLLFLLLPPLNKAWKNQQGIITLKQNKAIVGYRRNAIRLRSLLKIMFESVLLKHCYEHFSNLDHLKRCCFLHGKKLILLKKKSKYLATILWFIAHAYAFPH